MIEQTDLLTDLQPMAKLSVAQEAAVEARLKARSDDHRTPTIPPRQGSGPEPLSFAQQRLWFLDQLLPGTALYNVPMAARIRGPLDGAALRRGLNHILRRHETLRTTFEVMDGIAVQVVGAPADFPLSIVDLADVTPAEREERASQLASAEVRAPFSLASGPMIRGLLIRFHPADHLLVLSMHHIVCDAWSLGVLRRELAALYRAATIGQQADLPELPRQYADYAAWQRQHPSDEALQDDLRYWRTQLANLPALQLPTDHPRSPLPAFDGATHRFVLPRDLTAGVAELSRREGVTLFMTLLCAYHVLLHRYSGQDDIVVASPIAGRMLPELEPLIGFFVNTLLLRLKLAGQPSFRTLLRQAREVALEAFAHQELPFEKLVDDLQPERQVSENPLFQVSFALHNTDMGRFEFEGATTEPLAIDAGVAKCDLQLSIEETSQGLECELIYSTQLFDSSTIERMAGHFKTLLQGALEDANTPIGQLPLLSESERQQLSHWNATEAEFAEGRCLQELFEDHVARRPDAIAAVFHDERLSYRELNERANQLAHHLRSLGVGPEVLVAISVERSLDMVIGLLGILKAGGAYLPLDPGYPSERLAFMLDDAQGPLLITQQGVEDRLPTHRARVLRLDADWAAISGECADNPPLQSTDKTLAYVIYTSGSTGKPKGVMIEHRGLCNVVAAQQQLFGVGPGDRVLQFSSLSFDASIFEIAMALGTGATLVIGKAASLLPGPDFVRFLQDHEVSIVTLPPSALTALPASELPALRTITVAGEACPAELVDRWALGRRFFNLYGPTEATIWSTAAACQPGSGKPSIGGPISNVQTYVLDDQLQPVPIGVAGELYIGGVGLARGYLKRPELTEERFIPHPLTGDGQARLYKTGDVVRYLPNGTLDYLGRSDEQVKIRGFRVEPGEIEAALRRHPEVRDAVVVAREDQPGDKRLVAYVVPAAAEGIAGADELRDHIRRDLPEHMVPAAFVRLDALPLTPNGKVDRRALPAPGVGRPHIQAAFVAPSSELERTIAGVWRDVLGFEEVGLQDNFFDLGGNSLLAVEVHRRLVDVLDREFSLIELFQYPTVAALAVHLRFGADDPNSDGKRDAASRGTAIGDHEIAIIGMSGRFPGARTLDEFWQNLRSARESITPFSEDELRAAGVDEDTLRQPNYVRAGAPLEDVELFDAAFFGYNPREADIMDPQQRLFLECAWQALEDAGCNPSTERRPIGVFAGAGSNSYLLNLYANESLWGSAGPYQIALGNEKDHLSTRVSYKLNLRGPSMTVQTSCSTSLVAVATACKTLAEGACEVALAGGISLRLDRTGYLYEDGGLLSPDGHCRVFDAAAQGTVQGSGVGVVVLKRLADAIADGDHVRAVIKGWALNNDGSSKVGYTAPGVDGQAEVIAQAQALAGVDASTISYVEAHGTGTVLGDPIELSALTRAFRASTDRQGYCAIGSVKTNIGHVDAAAGVAGLIKTALALEHRELPPSLHFIQANPKFDLAASPFYVNANLAPWETNGAPRRAGVSSFGIGGTNAHLVLEEAPGHARSEDSSKCQLLVLSAKTATALDTATDNLAAYLADHDGLNLADHDGLNLADHDGLNLADHDGLNLADVAYSLQRGRTSFGQRRVVACRDVDGAVAALKSRDPLYVLSGAHETAERPLAFMFPGGGTQYVQMAAGLYQTEAVFRQAIDRCAELLEPQVGLDLRTLLYPSPAHAAQAARQLDEIALMQPALFVIEYSLAQLWLSWGFEPQAMIGHSNGEYVAACLAEVFSLEDALRLVATRGQLMQQMPSGAMLAVALPEHELTAMLDGELSLGAVNGPDLCVVSGPASAADRLTQRLAASGVEHSRLHISHASHSKMMDPVLQPFETAVREAKLNAPRLPYLSNVTGTWITAAQATDPSYWSAHMRQTVRFADGLTELLRDPDRVLLEIGPGQTLSRLARQHTLWSSDHIAVTSLPGPRDKDDDSQVLMTAVGRLWLAGIPVDWSRLHAAERRRHVPLPTYPFERQRHWIEPDRRSAPAGLGRATLRKSGDVSSWFYIPSWKRSLLGAAGSRQEALTEHWLLFVDGSGIGIELARQLTQLRCDATVVAADQRFSRLNDRNFTVRPNHRDDYDAVLQLLESQGRRPTRIVHMWGLAEADKRMPAEHRLAMAQEVGFYSLLHLARAVVDLPRAEPTHIVVVSNKMQAVAGEDDLNPEYATVLGACKVIPQEYPALQCRSVDVVLPSSAAAASQLVGQLLQECGAAAADRVVAYRNHDRWVQTFEPVRLESAPQGQTRLRPGGVYLITGGLGRIGLTLAEELASSCQARLALVARSELPKRGDWDAWLSGHGEADRVSQTIMRLRAMEAAGAQVLTLRADVTDEKQMRQVVRTVRRQFGALHGVLHTAGLTDGSLLPIEQTDRALCEQHFGPKVRGLLVMREVLRECEPDFWLLFSSLSSVLGGIGHVAYSAANQFMDAFAAKHSRDDATTWISVNWDGWGFPSVLGQREGLGSSLVELAMQPEEGVEAFRRIMSLQPVNAQLLISTGDLQARIDQWVNLHTAHQEAEEQAPSAAPVHARPQVATAYLAPRDDVERGIAEVWQELLGVQQVGVHDDFFELGGHSLLAVRLVDRLSKKFGRHLSVQSFIDGATVEYQAKLIRPERDSAPAAVAPDEERPSCVKAIQPHGSKPPLFLWVDSADGTILHFRHFVRHLGPDQPLYALEWRMPANRTMTVQDCAAIFARGIRDVQAHGPYFVAGHSFGGMLAFEIGVALQSQGEEVAFVALLDTLGPPDPLNSGPVPRLTRIRSRAQTLKFLGTREKADYLLARGRDFARRGWRKLRHAPPAPSATPTDWISIMIGVMGGTLDAGEYVPSREFDGRLTYFLSDASTEPHDYDWRAGWHRFATRGLDMIRVPGDHATMLLEPAVHVLADKLKAALERAQRQVSQRSRPDHAGAAWSAPLPEVLGE